jgi:hypothetical protein
MAIQYDWIINKLVTEPSIDGLSNVVKEIHYAYTAYEEMGNNIAQATIYDTYICPAPDGESFIEYSGLSENTIIGWMITGLDMNKITNYVNELLVKRKIEIASKPKMPW